MNKRQASKGERLKGLWLVDAEGHATDDPRVLSGDRPGATAGGRFAKASNFMRTSSPL
jgi:LDH2 family malate/lactate/ureidoglycolate dehydrogenase